MDTDEFVHRFPRLYHMAEDGSWPVIQRLGLLSTSALLDAFEVVGEERLALTARRRPESVRITHPTLGDAVIRDQKPLNDEVLARVLEDGLAPEDWYRILNAHVFFWPSEERLTRLLQARAYRGEAHTVLTVDTRALVGRLGEAVRLSPINSGSTLFDARPRGRNTLLAIDEYPFDYWAARRTPATAIAEVAVVHSVPDVGDIVLRADRRREDRVLDVLYER